MARSEFLDSDRLYVSFPLAQLDDQGNVSTEKLQMPDCSCNWSRFSKLKDVLYRENGRLTDGCFSFSVADVKFDGYAVVVHDPVCGKIPENYSHCELRLDPGELKPNDEPPHGQKKAKSKTAKGLRNAWRRNLALKVKIELEPQA